MGCSVRLVDLSDVIYYGGLLIAMILGRGKSMMGFKKIMID